LSAINPLNLFRRKADAGVTPLPKEQEIETLPSASVSALPAATTTPSSASLPTAAFARYEYRGAFNVVSGDRNQAETLLSQGNTAMRMKRYDEAVLLYRQAAQADPGWFNAQQNLTAAALESGNLSEALKAGETALALRPDSAEARYNFALALRRSNYVLDAAAQLERLLAENPDDVRAHLTAGNLYAEQLRMKDRARAHYRKVLELNPRHPQAGAIRFWLVQNPR
jgi:tetratricopeptide (TPR) repeat protein